MISFPPNSPPNLTIYLVKKPTPRMKPLSNATIEDIISACKPGVSLYCISKLVGVSKSTVYRVLKARGLHTKETHNGPKKKLSVRKEQHIVRKFSDKKFLIASDATRWVKSRHELSVSEETVRRLLGKNNIKSYNRLKKPALTKRHMMTRLSFCKVVGNWDLTDWKKIIFSDESKFNLHGADSASRVWCRANQRFDQANIKAVKKFGGGNVMVWGCITSSGVGKIVKISNKMNSAEYCEVLYKGFIGTLEMYGLRPKSVIFMQDNAACHTSAATKNWFSINKIQVLDWPSVSPDLNPIENVWDYLNKQLRSRKQVFTNHEEIWKILQEEWYLIPREYISRLYFSMCNRIELVKKANGGITKY